MIYTTAQVAQRLGVTPRAVRALAQRHNIGTLLTDRQRIYTEDDVQRIAARVGQQGKRLTPEPRT